MHVGSIVRLAPLSPNQESLFQMFCYGLVVKCCRIIFHINLLRDVVVSSPTIWAQ